MREIIYWFKNICNEEINIDLNSNSNNYEENKNSTFNNNYNSKNKIFNSNDNINKNSTNFFLMNNLSENNFLKTEQEKKIKFNNENLIDE